MDFALFGIGLGVAFGCYMERKDLRMLRKSCELLWIDYRYGLEIAYSVADKPEDLEVHNELLKSDISYIEYLQKYQMYGEVTVDYLRQIPTVFAPTIKIEIGRLLTYATHENKKVLWKFWALTLFFFPYTLVGMFASNLVLWVYAAATTRYNGAAFNTTHSIIANVAEKELP